MSIDIVKAEIKNLECNQSGNKMASDWKLKLWKLSSF